MFNDILKKQKSVVAHYQPEKAISCSVRRKVTLERIRGYDQCSSKVEHRVAIVAK